MSADPEMMKQKHHKNIPSVSDKEADDIIEFLGMTGDSEFLDMKLD